MALFPVAPEDLAALSDDELHTFIEASADVDVAAIAADPGAFVPEGGSPTDLLVEVRAGVAALKAARAEYASRDSEDEDEENDEVEEVEDEDGNEALAAELAELAAEADDETVEELEVEPEPVEPVVAAAVRTKLRRPARSARSAPQQKPVETIALTAAAGGLGYDIGDRVPDPVTAAEMMVKRRSQFGNISEGTNGEKIPIVKADWRHAYPPERTFAGGDHVINTGLIDAVVKPREIKAELQRRRKLGLTASGGLCAPVTPYYGLEMLSETMRPVRASLPSFNADRGGIRYARPAALTSVTTAVGVISAAHDAAGGSSATKTCQIVPCPPFQETDVETIFHCLQFGNLGARTFPERVAQWNQLVLAAHARTAESLLLSAIDLGSTQVIAKSGTVLGASSQLLPQILTAANGMRNRHRMDPEAVLRLMIPDWAIDLMISDIIRSQFQRFDTDEARITALLRSFDVEPTFYVDGANGRAQVFGPQLAAPLLAFPSTVNWFLFPEGSWLYVDGGTLELGLVRDSVLNATNDFQIFGESFENVAFVGVESLSVISTVCDNGVVSNPGSYTTCGNYA